MSGKYPTVRRSQVITTWGPGALIALPRHAGIVGSLEVWPHPGELEEIVDQRITQKLALLMGIAAPKRTPTSVKIASVAAERVSVAQDDIASVAGCPPFPCLLGSQFGCDERVGRTLWPTLDSSDQPAE